MVSFFFSHPKPLARLRRHTEKCLDIPATLLPLINGRRLRMEKLILLEQGNTAWINSITPYSPSTQCGRFSRRSAPLFEFQRQFGDLPLQPQRDQRRQAEASSKKSAHVDIASRCGLLKVNPYLLQDVGYYVNPAAKA